jgi:hypothetical protein
MSEARPHPQPGELWRTYDMTPFGPGAISSLVQVVDVAPNRQVGRDIVRYQCVHPVEADRICWLPLDRFVNGHAAPYESEEEWMRRRGVGSVSGRQASWNEAIGKAVAALKADAPESAGPVRPDEEATT